MEQGRIGSLRTFAKLKDLFAGPIPMPYSKPALADINGVGSTYFVENDLGASPGFDSLFDFLHMHYFLRQTWAKLTVSLAKFYFFVDEIRVLGSYLCEIRVTASTGQSSSCS